MSFFRSDINCTTFEFYHDAKVGLVVVMEGDGGNSRVTYIRIEFVSGSIKTKNQCATVMGFGNDFVVPLNWGEGCGRTGDLSASVRAVAHDARCRDVERESSLVVVVNRERLRKPPVVVSSGMNHLGLNMLILNEKAVSRGRRSPAFSDWNRSSSLLITIIVTRA